MDLNEALAALRGAFPRVGWTATEDEPGSWTIRGGGLMIWNYSAGWMCQDKVAPTPLLSVRAWLAAQPTAMFYPEVQGGETEEYAGWIAIGSRKDYGLSRDLGEGLEWESKQTAADGLDHHCDESRFHRFVVRVPVPVEPPVLVGEVVP